MVRASICRCLPTDIFIFSFIYLPRKMIVLQTNERLGDDNGHKHIFGSEFIWRGSFYYWIIRLQTIVKFNVFSSLVYAHDSDIRDCAIISTVWCGFVYVAQLTLHLMTELVRDWSIFRRFMNFYECLWILSVALNSKAILFSIGVFFIALQFRNSEPIEWFISQQSTHWCVCVCLCF